MADPTLKTASVVIKYRSSDGYRSEVSYGKGDPGAVLVSALEELARLTALFGLEREAQQAFAAAQYRVREWRVQTGRVGAAQQGDTNA